MEVQPLSALGVGVAASSLLLLLLPLLLPLLSDDAFASGSGFAYGAPLVAPSLTVLGQLMVGPSDAAAAAAAAAGQSPPEMVDMAAALFALQSRVITLEQQSTTPAVSEAKASLLA